MKIIKLPVLPSNAGVVVRVYSANRTMYMPVFLDLQRLKYSSQYCEFSENMVLHSMFSYITSLK